MACRPRWSSRWPRSGKELWAAPLRVANYGHDGGNSGESGNDGGDGPRSTPTFADGRFFVMGSDLDLSCFNAADGKPVWRKDLVADFGGSNIRWKNAASPLVEDGLVFVAGGGPGQALLALKAETGEAVWKAENDKMTHATPTAATIHGVRQIIFFTQSGLVSVAPKTGKVLWRYPFPFRVSTAASPIVSGDLVYCAAGYGVGMGCAKIVKKGDAFEAEELWRKEGDKVTNHWSTPVCKDGHLYGMFSFKNYGKGPLSASISPPVTSNGARTDSAPATLSSPAATPSSPSVTRAKSSSLRPRPTNIRNSLEPMSSTANAGPPQSSPAAASTPAAPNKRSASTWHGRTSQNRSVRSHRRTVRRCRRWRAFARPCTPAVRRKCYGPDGIGMSLQKRASSLAHRVVQKSRSTCPSR